MPSYENVQSMLKIGPQHEIYPWFQRQNFSKSFSDFQFRRLDFGMILLLNQWELGLGLLIEIIDGMKGCNFGLDGLR